MTNTYFLSLSRLYVTTLVSLTWNMLTCKAAIMGSSHAVHADEGLRIHQPVSPPDSRKQAPLPLQMTGKHRLFQVQTVAVTCPIRSAPSSRVRARSRRPTDMQFATLKKKLG